MGQRFFNFVPSNSTVLIYSCVGGGNGMPLFKNQNKSNQNNNNYSKESERNRESDRVRDRQSEEFLNKCQSVPR